MNQEDERDYAEEEANRAAMEQEGLEELAEETGFSVEAIKELREAGLVTVEKAVQERLETVQRKRVTFDPAVLKQVSEVVRVNERGNLVIGLKPDRDEAEVDRQPPFGTDLPRRKPGEALKALLRLHQRERIMAAIEARANYVMSKLMDYQPQAFHDYAMQEAGVDQETLDELGEAATGDYEDPRYSLYWEVLSGLQAQVLFEVGKQIRYYR